MQPDPSHIQRLPKAIRLSLLIGQLFVLPCALAGDAAPSPVTLAEVTIEAFHQEIQLSGNSIPKRRALLSPRVDGLVTRLLVDEGGWVEPGDAILELDAQLADIEIDVAVAQLRGAAARNQDAIRKRDELIKLKIGRHAAETSVESAIAEVEITAADQARERAQLDRARALRERHSVAAPFAGMVVSKRVEVGAWVKQGDAVVELVAMDTLRVRALLPQRYFPYVKIGTKARVFFDALPDQEFEGSIIARVALGNEASRSFPLLIDIVNPGHLLAPGMSARIQVRMDNGATEALSVPRDAVVAKSDGSRVVWRVKQEDKRFKALPVTIKTGRAQGDRLEVIGGSLQSGERIVLLGNENLRSGQTVVPQAEGPAATAD